jgi:tricorn protease interacting factor F2/3
MEPQLSISLYDVYVDLDFESLSYNGHEKILLSTGGDLELDCEGLEVQWVRAAGRDVGWVLDNHKLRVSCGAFKGELEVAFSGRVPSGSVVGIYAASHEGGRIVTTQFESTYARRFIPCFDHPGFKARFKLTVRVKDGLKVISNMPPETVESSAGSQTIVFRESPPMPTYLLYLGVGDFHEYDYGDRRPNIIVAVLAGRDAKASYPLKVGRQVLEFFNQYFGLEYPLPKLHFIAVPDTSVGGMENWGAITFGEAYLLASDDSPVLQRLLSAEVIAHEVAHQWFGDLVTMKWWDDLWLNESFATVMSYKALENLFPEWDAQGVFQFNEMGGGLLADSLSTTHPIQAEVNEAHEIESIFDNISYSKGASVLRMLERFMGETSFRRGVQAYLSKYAYSNAVGSDFWGELGAASGKDIGHIAEQWIRTPGYPLIHAEVLGRRLKLTQERFSLSCRVPRTTYTVPLTLEVNGKASSMVLSGESTTMEFEGDIRSLKVNLNRSGFYRVRYSDLSLLAPLNNLEKGGLLDDYYNLFLAGKLGFEDYRRVLEDLTNEQHDYLPVWEASSETWQLYTIKPEKYSELATQIHLKLLKAWMKATGDMAKLTRSTVSERLVRLDASYALGLSEFFSDYGSVPQELRQAVVCGYAVATQDFDSLLKRYVETVDPEDKQRFLRGLTAIPSEESFGRLVEHVFKGTFKARDGLVIVASAGANPKQRRALMKTLQESYKLFEDYAEKLTGHRWLASKPLKDPLAREGATRATDVEAILKMMYSRETERDVNEIRELMEAYSRT